MEVIFGLTLSAVIIVGLNFLIGHEAGKLLSSLERSGSKKSLADLNQRLGVVKSDKQNRAKKGS